ncbi:TPR repeat protein [Pseudohaliea rubra DSM 19751]|uniref:TPR repeat protein n=1 Tax=Pseudohaliea rubra DSM 19751 TaxID=1265313 RepID=A0A095VV64_9GAMM|nr:TPR repeat protein [Pseudohaliea rubra DSM 19751]
MAFWEQRCPERLLTVDYEALVEAPRETMQRVHEFAGLSWNEACLDFHKSGRAVRTASATQVRRPLYQGSSEAWRRFEHHLTPLLVDLGLL